MGKAEGNVHQEQWHGHVTAVTVSPEYRRIGLASHLMKSLENISERFVKQGYAVLSLSFLCR